MKRWIPTLLPLAVTALLAGCMYDDSDEPTGASRAPLFEGLGDHHYPVTTSSELAQRYFDQGMVLYYGFNHAEAERSFRQAAALDTTCAMCWWGAALALGPNINAPMEDEAVPRAWEALEQTRAQLTGASERERALIEALAARYVPEPVEDRGHLDQAYADAMGEVVRQLPGDPEAATLYAEALMDTTAWDYWIDSETPKPVTETILAALEGVLENEPNHPGANHLYIHAIEPSGHPERALPAAERLGGLAPSAGHLVHMPSHIFLRVGRYEDAAEANVLADQADDDYVTQCHAQGAYPLAYHSHNRHFLWYARTMEGKSAEALDAARGVAEKAEGDPLRMPGMETMQFYWMTPAFAMVRFGRWADILTMPPPAEDLLFPNAIWRYARGLAFTRTGRLEEAAAELDELEGLAADPDLDELSVWGLNSFSQLADIAQEVVTGELAWARGDREAAIASFERGIEMEDRLVYDEPPTWHAPLRHHLGAVLLEAGNAERAEAVYRKDLAKFPHSGWSLFGLAQSLEAQGREEEAARAREEFQTIWAEADVELSASRI